jgi:uncharacterized protein (TIGR00251 family)
MVKITSNQEGRIAVRVVPNAPRSEVIGFVGEALRVKVAAPPVKGKANKELFALLSRVLAVDKSRISIVAGETSRNKIIAVDGLGREEVMKRLSSSGAGASR